MTAMQSVRSSEVASSGFAIGRKMRRYVIDNDPDEMGHSLVRTQCDTSRDHAKEYGAT